MPDCRYCTESFPDGNPYLQHLNKMHRDELSRIDKRKLEQHPEIKPPSSIGPVVVQTLILFAALAFLAGGLYLIYTVGYGMI